MKHFFAFILTLSIPCLLLLTVRQSWAYNALDREVRAYDNEQQRLIAENKRKISAISILSKPQRIEKIAVEELQMRKAESSEIIRISLDTGKKGKL
ncbi:MAG: cell division protein FtsL [Treponema sp.]